MKSEFPQAQYVMRIENLIEFEALAETVGAVVQTARILLDEGDIDNAKESLTSCEEALMELWNFDFRLQCRRISIINANPE